MRLQLLLSIAGTILLPVRGFSPTQHNAMAITQASTVALTRRHQIQKHHHLAAPAAFTSPTRLSFTPKEDSESSDDKPFIRPALHNSPFFRSLAIVYALLFAIYQGSTAPSASTNALQKVGKYFILSPKAAATVHLLAFSTWFGTVVYTTFIAGITMFKNLPR